MKIKSLQLSNSASFVALTVLFFALVLINNQIFQGVRFDLTENKLYTLTDGTRNILENIGEPITLYLFFSEEPAADYPQIRNYYERVRDTLEEYEQHADGKLIVQYVNPEPFSEEEDRAAKLGLQNATPGSGDSLYFGVAGSNVLDDIDVIPFLQQSKETFLEYELSKLIYNLTRLKKPVLGLMTSLDMYPTRLNPATGQMNEPWFMTQQLEQLFDVRLVHADAEDIESEIDVLMVVHPKFLEDGTFYAIDQFIMRGGKGLFYVDPYSNKEVVPTPADQPLPEKDARSSSLNRLFEAWGFRVDDDAVVGDPGRSLRVSLSSGGTAKHLAMLNMKAQDFNTNDVVMDGLEDINLGFASYVEQTDDAADIDIEPLIQTGKKAGLIPLDRLRFTPHPDNLKQGFSAGGKNYTIAARVRGQFNSAFEQPPEGLEGTTEHLAETVGEANLIVVADTDLLTDEMWAQSQNFFGRRIIQPIANNRDLAINLVANLFGNSDLIGIRSRTTYSRPFTKVQEIEVRADRKYRATEENLSREYAKATRKLQELQEERPDKNNVLLTKEQKAEIRAVEAKLLDVRKQLRNVRHQQVKDTESLGAYIKVINIGVVPGIVTLIALLAAFLKVHRRRRGTA